MCKVRVPEARRERSECFLDRLCCLYTRAVEFSIFIGSFSLAKIGSVPLKPNWARSTIMEHVRQIRHCKSRTIESLISRRHKTRGVSAELELSQPQPSGWARELSWADPNSILSMYDVWVSVERASTYRRAIRLHALCVVCSYERVSI